MIIKPLSINIPGGTLRKKMAENAPFVKRDTLEGAHIAKLRSSERWQSLREWVLRRHPVCMVCGDRPALEIHHIVEASRNPGLFFEVSNLAPLCEGCHEKIHGAYRRGFTSDQLFPADKRIGADDCGGI